MSASEVFVSEEDFAIMRAEMRQLIHDTDMSVSDAAATVVLNYWTAMSKRFMPLLQAQLTKEPVIIIPQKEIPRC